MKKIGILIGSKSDLAVMEDCFSILKQFNVSYETHVLSAHRTPDAVAEFAKNAHQNGFSIVIAAAGKAAHLAGVIAGHTAMPVIGLPIKSSTLDGLDSLLSVVQMPSGVPVATVAINGALNAGLLAIQILAVSDINLYSSLVAYKKALCDKLLAEDNLTNS
ncbi:MAG: 5-(carboxyamino)imidazole ribonucleotide mutase [Christensenellaceae bacterium]|jgi:5-(carboxyamino)imidazole ribonucleotide mutase|nr:5-(carboxyamino)imidazole ribonucleotide mutase [Christensenellaceae bacterium]